MPMKSDAPRGRILDGLGLVGALLVVLGPTLAWLRVVPGIMGFGLYALGGLLAVIAGVSALVAAARGRGFGLGRTLALVAAMVFVVTVTAAGSAPRINDFTTDPGDPPLFSEAARIPANADRDMGYPAAFVDEQAVCCPDLRPARIAAPPDQAFAAAKRAADAMGGWEVTATDPAEGRIEAVATTAIFGFHDDIAIRVRPDGTGSRVDVRSKSRDGRGDLGANANRIRAYVATVESQP
jgi:uncharacterized protein (DUF1499 family)